MYLADGTSLLAPSVSEAQATATTAWPEDSLNHTPKPKALGGRQAAKDAPSHRGVCCFGQQQTGCREPVNTKHRGGLLRDFTLSCQSCDLISFEERKKKRTHILQPSICEGRRHDASSMHSGHSPKQRS